MSLAKVGLLEGAEGLLGGVEAFFEGGSGHVAEPLHEGGRERNVIFKADAEILLR